MKRLPVIALSVLLGSVVAAPAAGALPVLPADAGNITPSIDWEKSFSPVISASGFDCTITSATGTTAVTVGQKFSPMTNQMTDGATLLGLINTRTANAGADCTSSVVLPSGPISVSGTFSAPGLAAVEGVGGSGTIALSCTATSKLSPFTVTVAANFGGAVPGKAKITGKSGPSDISFDCSMSLAFSGGAALAGTVNGLLAVADPVTNTSCTAVTGPTCIPVGVATSTVTIAGGSGAFADAAGTGTYAFNDYIKLSQLESSLSMVGISSVRTASVRPRVAANADELKLSISKGAPTVRVFRPSTAGTVQFGKGSTWDVVSAPLAKCAMTATYRKKSVTIGSVTLSASGTGTIPFASSATKKLKTAGLKKNTAAALKITCTKDAAKPSLSLKGKYSG